MSKENLLSIRGNPYDLIETFRWILKHTIYDLLYPLILFMFVLSIFELINVYLMLLVICEVIVILSYFFFYWIRSKRTQEKNIGNYDKKCKWRSQILNTIDERDIIYEIGFVGDIMKMKKYKLKFGNNINNFFKGVDLMVGNLEGIINDKKTINIIKQKHRSAILKDLKKITAPTPKWLLCISNNHSADFKDYYFYKTRDFIDSNCGFQAFGYKNKEYYSPKKRINIVSGTMWNNYKNDYVSQFREVNTFYDPNCFNILYPHWHFENECYIRSKIKERCRKLLTEGVYYDFKKYLPKKLQRKPIKKYQKKPNISAKWDLIFGHHTHVPQPIVNVPPPNNLNQTHLLAYSGGNFTSSKWIGKHQHGLILRCQIAKKNDEDSLAIRRIDWSYTECTRDRKAKTVQVDIDVTHNYKNSYDFRVTKTLKNILIVSIFYFIATIIFSELFSIPILKILDVFIKSISIIGIQFIAVWAISRILFKYKYL